MYARAVWVEDDRETEGTVPVNWVDKEKGVVMWPKNKATKAFQLKEDPKDDWMTFKLIKIKMTSETSLECEQYTLTSNSEEENEEEVVMKRRRKASKRLPEDFDQQAEADHPRRRSPRLAHRRWQHCTSLINDEDTTLLQYSFPLSTEDFQREVINLLMEIRSGIIYIRSALASLKAMGFRVEAMDFMEDFRREEQRFSDLEAFNVPL